jgi:tripartite-type tricarboxylate transporter receptor subunit TctC
MSFSIRPFALAALASTWVAFAPAHAQSPATASDWPAKPLRMIVPANAGGGTANPVSRVLADELTRMLNQRVYIENRGGANGNIGAALAAKAPNDGYSVLFSWAGTLATNISLYDSIPFHPVNDFDPVILIGGVSNILVVNNDMPVRSLKEFVDYVKARPGALNYASSGNGSSMHLAGELFKKQTGTFMVHVPYNNVGQATTDLMANQIQLMFHLIVGAKGAVSAGQVRPIAVLAPERSPVMPDVPTMNELGMPIESQTWFAFLFPKGAPREAITRLNEVTNQLLKDPAARKKLMEMGLEPAGGTPQRLAQHLDDEIKKWSEVVKFSGARIN